MPLLNKNMAYCTIEKLLTSISEEQLAQLTGDDGGHVNEDVANGISRVIKFGSRFVFTQALPHTFGDRPGCYL